MVKEREKKAAADLTREEICNLTKAEVNEITRDDLRTIARKLGEDPNGKSKDDLVDLVCSTIEKINAANPAASEPPPETAGEKDDKVPVFRVGDREPKPLNGMNEICRAVNRSESTVLDLVRTRHLPAIKEGGVWISDLNLINDWRDWLFETGQTRRRRTYA